MFSLVIIITLSLASFVIHAWCGVMIQLRACNKGLSSVGGSFDNTSNAAPAITLLFNASAKSFSFINCPRAVLINNAEGFIEASNFASTKPVLLIVSGQCNDTTSLA